MNPETPGFTEEVNNEFEHGQVYSVQGRFKEAVTNEHDQLGKIVFSTVFGGPKSMRDNYSAEAGHMGGEISIIATNEEAENFSGGLLEGVLEEPLPNNQFRYITVEAKKLEQSK